MTSTEAAGRLQLKRAGSKAAKRPRIESQVSPVPSGVFVSNKGASPLPFQEESRVLDSSALVARLLDSDLHETPHGSILNSVSIAQNAFI